MKKKIGRVVKWDEITRTGWIRTSVSELEIRDYFFSSKTMQKDYFPVRGDRVGFLVKTTRKGVEYANDVHFLRTC